MLRIFEVENFFSIRERQILDLRAKENAPALPQRLVKPHEGATDRVSRVALLLGANASGKSNVLKGLSFLVHFARGQPEWPADAASPFFPFGGNDWHTKPTRLYAEFDGQLIPNTPICTYSYEVIFQHKRETGRSTVVHEALKYNPEGRSKRLLEREANKFLLAPEFGVRRDDPRLTFIGECSSAFPILAKFNHPLSIEIVRTLNRIQTNINAQNRFEMSADSMTKYYEKTPAVLAMLRDRI